jgi:hypothetical protein
MLVDSGNVSSIVRWVGEIRNPSLMIYFRNIANKVTSVATLCQRDGVGILPSRLIQISSLYRVAARIVVGADVSLEGFVHVDFEHWLLSLAL